jgi:hypothetical protein
MVVDKKNMAWLREHDHMVNPPAVGSLANTKLTHIGPAAN